MNDNAIIFERLDYLKGDRIENVNIEHPETIRVSPVEQVKPAVQTGELPKDAVDKQREDKIDSWMKSIQEFIRGIDVKAL